jgi:hypothetical protein
MQLYKKDKLNYLKTQLTRQEKIQRESIEEFYKRVGFKQLNALTHMGTPASLIKVISSLIDQ